MRRWLIAYLLSKEVGLLRDICRASCLGWRDAKWGQQQSIPYGCDLLRASWLVGNDWRKQIDPPEMH
jgi:hypothetical protein